MRFASLARRIVAGASFTALLFGCTLIQAHDWRPHHFNNEPKPLVIGHRGGAAATCPSTRWRPMRWPSSWAPTTSSPTWWPPRTAT